MRYGGRDAATGPAGRPPDLAVVRQTDVNPYAALRVMFLIVTRMSLSSSPVCGCGALPTPVEQHADGLNARGVGRHVADTRVIR